MDVCGGHAMEYMSHPHPPPSHTKRLLCLVLDMLEEYDDESASIHKPANPTKFSFSVALR